MQQPEERRFSMSKINDADLRRRLELLASVRPSPEATSRAMDRVRQTILETEGQQARKSLGRIIMNSKWSKLAVAAGVVVTVLIGLQFIGSSRVTFAQAIQPILNATSKDHIQNKRHQTRDSPFRLTSQVNKPGSLENNHWRSGASPDSSTENHIGTDNFPASCIYRLLNQYR